jgi:hypothetical protein
MQLPVRSRDSSSLEYRRRIIRGRHRRAAIREFAGMALWSIGLLAGGVVAVALALGLTGR